MTYELFHVLKSFADNNPQNLEKLTESEFRSLSERKVISHDRTDFEPCTYTQPLCL